MVGEWVGFDHSGFQFRVEAADGGGAPLVEDLSVGVGLESH